MNEGDCVCAQIYTLVEVRGHPWVLFVRKPSSLLFMFIYVYTYFSVYVCMCVCNTMCVWRLEDKLQELISPSIT